jgi:hypothetical protein
VDEPLDADVIEAHLPADQPHTRWFLRRFADAVGDYYRTMDPHVAQLITAPGVLPATPSGPEPP